MELLTGDIFGGVISIVLIITGVVFLVVSASLIYHWHYYGISVIRRTFIIVLFLGVSFVLYMAAWGLALEYI